MKNDRREAASRPQARRSPRTEADRRAPAFYGRRADVARLVAVLTLLDTLVKLVIVGATCE